MHELYKILLDPSCDDSVRRFAIMTFRDKENMTRFTIFDKGKLLTGELFSTENQPDKTDDEEKEDDCPHLQAPFGRLNALLQQKLCNCSKKIGRKPKILLKRLRNCTMIWGWHYPIRRFLHMQRRLIIHAAL